jgi:IS1 family transposase
LWNTKVSEAKAESVAEHLAEGCSLKGTARLVKVNASVVRRLKRKTGIQAKAFHDERVHSLDVVALEADERHGYAIDKQHPVWEAEVIDPTSKFVVSHVQGARDEPLIRRLLEDAARRLTDHHRLVLLTDGEVSYASLFPEIFGQAYRPARQGARGHLPALRYRIPRTLAHVQIVKQRIGSRVVAVDIRYAHGSQRCVQRTLDYLGYLVPNTSAVERRNGTARRMSAHQVRRSLAFAHRTDTKLDLGWWGLTVYNWSRPHRSLRLPLSQPDGKKSLNHVPPRWPSFSPIVFGLSVTSSLSRFFLHPLRDNLTSLPNLSHERLAVDGNDAR